MILLLTTSFRYRCAVNECLDRLMADRFATPCRRGAFLLVCSLLYCVLRRRAVLLGSDQLKRMAGHQVFPCRTSFKAFLSLRLWKLFCLCLKNGSRDHFFILDFTEIFPTDNWICICSGANTLPPKFTKERSLKFSC